MSGVLTGFRTFRPGFRADIVAGGILRTRPFRLRDEFGGTGALSGIVTIRGVPAAREVLLYDVQTDTLVATMWSDQATGAFAFPNLNKARRFRVEAVDYVRQYNAVVADYVLPE